MAVNRLHPPPIEELKRMDVSVSPGQRLTGIFLTLASLGSLAAFGLASWVAGIELFGGARSAPDRWLGLALGVIFAAGFAAGAVASWAEYKRERMGLAAVYASAPYVALALCWIGLKSLGR
jgi:hypothetical protein